MDFGNKISTSIKKERKTNPVRTFRFSRIEDNFDTLGIRKNCGECKINYILNMFQRFLDRKNQEKIILLVRVNLYHWLHIRKYLHSASRHKRNTLSKLIKKRYVKNKYF